MYIIEAAHNPEVAGSNPAPLLRGPGEQGVSLDPTVQDPPSDLTHCPSCRRLSTRNRGVNL